MKSVFRSTLAAAFCAAIFAQDAKGGIIRYTFVSGKFELQEAREPFSEAELVELSPWTLVIEIDASLFPGDLSNNVFGWNYGDGDNEWEPFVGTIRHRGGTFGHIDGVPRPIWLLTLDANFPPLGSAGTSYLFTTDSKRRLSSAEIKIHDGPPDRYIHFNSATEYNDYGSYRAPGSWRVEQIGTVPVPASFGLLGAGALALGATALRRRSGRAKG